tara:strand:+ start:575 stop:745 length:171 start_codon:yes stop_codon:yes gene_type:complete
MMIILKIYNVLKNYLEIDKSCEKVIQFDTCACHEGKENNAALLVGKCADARDRPDR